MGGLSVGLFCALLVGDDSCELFLPTTLDQSIGLSSIPISSKVCPMR